MKSDVEIIVGGPDFPTVVPVGATFSYGINMIPTATVMLDARSTYLLCDFDQHRRKLVSIQVNTTKGCLHFDGFLDGVNLSQQNGALSLALVIKNRHQWLLETFTRVPGLHPTSIEIYNNLPILKADLDAGNDEGFIKSVQLGQYALSRVSLEQPIFQVVKEVYRSALDLLEQTPRIFNLKVRQAPTVQLAQESEIFLRDKLPLAKAMINNIDTGAVDGMLLKAAASSLGPDLVNAAVQSLEGSLFEALVTMARQYGCNVIVGNTQMFIVPDVGFLKVPHGNGVLRTRQSTVPNILFPAEYTSHQFSDQGYRDIKGVMLASTPESMPLLVSTAGSRAIGTYTDPGAIGGFLFEYLPKFVSGPLEFIAITEGAATKQAIDRRDARRPDLATPEGEKQIFAAAELAAETAIERFINNVGNNWAQLVYLQRKFGDRTGSVNGVFDPGWAPGGVGTMFTRYPGTWIDFRVTNVEHNFSCTPGSASATTSISYDCGRVGGATSKGIDNVLFYNYDYPKAEAFARRFVANVT